MLTSVVLSMLAIIVLIFAIVQELTMIELSLFVEGLLRHPNTILWALACLCLIPIVVFSIVVSVISFTCDFYYNKKELEKEVKEINAIH